ncbi:hypothetical protein GQ55_7G189400 [Panicum hallii var. hallii]|uniref:Uncharacterized protein n=1 Tax=Panicum hallii var. hallii TaxID=1504633 RepID=A0A2T7CWL0_9POAL|nr:hypothetical protein GQ55_7G189400 [Panicum hallii var. hallii]
MPKDSGRAHPEKKARASSSLAPGVSRASGTRSERTDSLRDRGAAGRGRWHERRRAPGRGRRAAAAAAQRTGGGGAAAATARRTGAGRPPRRRRDGRGPRRSRGGWGPLRRRHAGRSGAEDGLRAVA